MPPIEISEENDVLIPLQMYYRVVQQDKDGKLPTSVQVALNNRRKHSGYFLDTWYIDSRLCMTSHYIP